MTHPGPRREQEYGSSCIRLQARKIFAIAQLTVSRRPLGLLQTRFSERRSQSLSIRPVLTKLGLWRFTLLFQAGYFRARRSARTARPPCFDRRSPARIWPSVPETRRPGPGDQARQLAWRGQPIQRACASHKSPYCPLENFQSGAFPQGFLNHLETPAPYPDS